MISRKLFGENGESAKRTTQLEEAYLVPNWIIHVGDLFQLGPVNGQPVPGMRAGLGVEGLKEIRQLY